MQQGNLTFSSPQVVTTAAGSGLRSGVDGDPVVARAGTSFFLAIVREEQGGGAGTLHGWRTQLFGSADGQTWSSISITPALEVHNQTYLGLGGASDGTLLAVAVRRVSSGSTGLSAARFANGQWQQVAPSEVAVMFNRPAAWKPFVVVGSKP